MSDSELQRYDSLERAKEEIMRALPEHFRFGVPCPPLYNRPDIIRAFEQEMHKLNYRSHRHYDAKKLEYLYDLRRYNRVEPEPEAPDFKPMALPKDQPIDI